MNDELVGFNQRWQAKYKLSEPRAENLKSEFTDSWVRFHMLPNSKRYPESKDEYSIILSRHNILIEELLTTDDVYLVSSIWSDELPNSSTYNENEMKAGILWRSFLESDKDEETDESSIRNLYVMRYKWSKGSIDDILRLIADDAMSGFMVIPINFAWIYHPYDGGADIVLSNSQDRDNLKSKYKDWLSSHPNGL